MQIKIRIQNPKFKLTKVLPRNQKRAGKDCDKQEVRHSLVAFAASGSKLFFFVSEFPIQYTCYWVVLYS